MVSNFKNKTIEIETFVSVRSSCNGRYGYVNFEGHMEMKMSLEIAKERALELMISGYH